MADDTLAEFHALNADYEPPPAPKRTWPAPQRRVLRSVKRGFCLAVGHRWGEPSVLASFRQAKWQCDRCRKVFSIRDPAIINPVQWQVERARERQAARYDASNNLPLGPDRLVE